MRVRPDKRAQASALSQVCRSASVIVVFAFAYPRLARWRTYAVLGKLWFLFFLSAFMASEFPCADTLRGHS